MKPDQFGQTWRPTQAVLVYPTNLQDTSLATQVTQVTQVTQEMQMTQVDIPLRRMLRYRVDRLTFSR